MSGDSSVLIAPSDNVPILKHIENENEQRTANKRDKIKQKAKIEENNLIIISELKKRTQ